MKIQVISMFYEHVHCTTKVLEPTLKEMKGNRDDKYYCYCQCLFPWQMNFRIFFNEFPLLLLHGLYGILWVEKATQWWFIIIFFMFVHITGGESALPLQWARRSKSNCQWWNLGVQQSKYIILYAFYFLWHKAYYPLSTMFTVGQVVFM